MDSGRRKPCCLGLAQIVIFFLLLLVLLLADFTSGLSMMRHTTGKALSKRSRFNHRLDRTNVFGGFAYPRLPRRLTLPVPKMPDAADESNCSFLNGQQHCHRRKMSFPRWVERYAPPGCRPARTRHSIAVCEGKCVSCQHPKALPKDQTRTLGDLFVRKCFCCVPSKTHTTRIVLICGSGNQAKRVVKRVSVPKECQCQLC